MEENVEIFISYADPDKRLLERLEKHLALLQRQGFITLWHNRNIIAGTNRKSEIDAHLQKAEIILLLVSANFFASDRCYSFEMQKAMELHKRGSAHVIPIILSPVNWQEAPFSHLQVLPANGVPITQGKWHTLNNDAFVDVVEGIKKVVSELMASKKMDTSLTNKRLKVLINSDMPELRDVRGFVANALNNRYVNAKVYEVNDGSRQEAIEKRLFAAIDEADIYIGLFWEQYKEAMSQAYRYARSLQKPCFAYIRDENCQREEELEDFLKAEVYNSHQDAHHDFFD